MPKTTLYDKEKRKLRTQWRKLSVDFWRENRLFNSNNNSVSLKPRIIPAILVTTLVKEFEPNKFERPRVKSDDSSGLACFRDLIQGGPSKNLNSASHPPPPPVSDQPIRPPAVPKEHSRGKKSSPNLK